MSKHKSRQQHRAARRERAPDQGSPGPPPPAPPALPGSTLPSRPRFSWVVLALVLALTVGSIVAFLLPDAPAPALAGLPVTPLLVQLAQVQMLAKKLAPWVYAVALLGEFAICGPLLTLLATPAPAALADKRATIRLRLRRLVPLALAGGTGYLLLAALGLVLWTDALPVGLTCLATWLCGWTSTALVARRAQQPRLPLWQLILVCLVAWPPLLQNLLRDEAASTGQGRSPHRPPARPRRKSE